MALSETQTRRSAPHERTCARRLISVRPRGRQGLRPWKVRRRSFTQASGFSQGMRQRVALARVLLRRPELLLLDEPYAGLDAEAKEIVDAAIAEALADGRTVVLATHDLQRGGTAARTIVMDQGRIVG